MVNLENYIVSEDTSIIEAMKVINRGEKSVVFVCKDNKLIAAVSDGDIRRFIIYGGNVENKVSVIANYNPVFIHENDDIDYDEMEMYANKINRNYAFKDKSDDFEIGR